MDKSWVWLVMSTIHNTSVCCNFLAYIHSMIDLISVSALYYTGEFVHSAVLSWNMICSLELWFLPVSLNFICWMALSTKMNKRKMQLQTEHWETCRWNCGRWYYAIRWNLQKWEQNLAAQYFEKAHDAWLFCTLPTFSKLFWTRWRFTFT